MAEKRRIRYWADPEKHRAYCRAWMAQNKDKVQARIAAYKDEARPFLAAQAKAKYWADPEKKRAAERARYANNRETLAARQKARRALAKQQRMENERPSSV